MTTTSTWPAMLGCSARRRRSWASRALCPSRKLPRAADHPGADWARLFRHRLRARRQRQHCRLRGRCLDARAQRQPGFPIRGSVCRQGDGNSRSSTNQRSPAQGRYRYCSSVRPTVSRLSAEHLSIVSWVVLKNGSYSKSITRKLGMPAAARAVWSSLIG